MQSQPKKYTDSIVTEVRDACARLLFLDAWASAIEGGECPACGAVDSEADSESASVVGLRLAIRRGDPCPECGRRIPSAGPGEACSNLATPVEAIALADHILAGLGGETGTREELERWDSAVYHRDSAAEFYVAADSPERFGTLLGYQALGHGIGLSDDVTLTSGYRSPRVRSVEFHASQFNGEALLERGAPSELVKRAREEAAGLRRLSDDWSEGGHPGPQPTDLDDLADLLDRLADGLQESRP